MHIHEPSEFEIAYFIQTRKEIDTEKKLRDTTLHFAILVLGAVCLAIYSSDDVLSLLRSVHGLALMGSAILLILGLFIVRREKLRQIADRWRVLNSMLAKNPDWIEYPLSLEQEVMKHFEPSNGEKQRKWLQRYSREDLVLNVMLCLPLFVGCMVFHRVLWGGVTALVLLVVILIVHSKRIP